ncbi:MAG: hypothetical protein GXP55_04825, partial [Deltaproteobacteria bacterium]|nr:hypothetical protein [Deltaproteobacteria bacterium]
FTTMDGPARLLENRSATGGAVEIRLEPSALACGSIVRATVASTSKRRDALCARSYLAGAPPRVRFGLGTQTRIGGLEVQWADGVRTRLPALEAGDTLVARRCAQLEECSPASSPPCFCVEVVVQDACSVSRGPSSGWPVLLLLVFPWASRRLRVAR